MAPNGPSSLTLYTTMGKQSGNVTVQCQHLIHALNAWAARPQNTTAHPIATKFPGHRCMDDLNNERSFDSQDTWVIDVLAFFDMSSNGVFTTGHWQTSCQLVQELNVCTVCVYFTVVVVHLFLNFKSHTCATEFLFLHSHIKTKSVMRTNNKNLLDILKI